MNKAPVPGRHGDRILYCGYSYLWLLSMEHVSRNLSSAWKFEIACRFLKNLWTFAGFSLTQVESRQLSAHTSIRCYKRTCFGAELRPHKRLTGLPTLREHNAVLWLLKYCKLPNNSCISFRIQSSQRGLGLNRALFSVLVIQKAPLRADEVLRCYLSAQQKVTKFSNKLTTSMRG